MRVNPEPVPQHAAARRRSVWVLGTLAALAIAVVVVQGLASFYVNYLWFGSDGVGMVWRAIVTSKLGLAGVFVMLALALVWVSLWLADKIAQRTLFLPVESDLVRRYHAVVMPHAFVLRTAVSVLVALALGAGTSSQWYHWELFRHAYSFGLADIQFHRDASFYVFRLPFLSFLTDWMLVALLVTFLVTLIVHFLNGTIRVQGPAHVEPRAIAHLSLLLGLMALVRAWAYYYVDRYALEVPHNGSVAAGVTSTGISVKLPAINLLAVISLIAFVVLIVNVYQRTLLLPLLAFGLWAVVALAIEVIYPAIDSAVASAPPQPGGAASSVAVASAARTIEGMGLSGVSVEDFPASADLTASVLTHYRQSLDDVTRWDTPQASAALSALQSGGPYYALGGVSANRYLENGRVVPVDIAVRQLDDSLLGDPTWSEVHAELTHGYGAVVASASAVGSDRAPVVQVGGLPPTASKGAPRLTRSGSQVYFVPSGGPQYLLVDTKQPEIDYQSSSSGRPALARPYRPGGSVAIGIGGFLPRLAFAVHLHDFNLLVSDLVTSRSRLVYLTDVRHRVQKALPFMRVDTDPYAVIAGGQLFWVYAAYVTSSYFPDAAPAPTGVLPAGSGLAGNYDYVRAAVVAVVNARTGAMRVFDLGGRDDPLLRADEAAFPGLVQPVTALRSFEGGAVYAHLRYPQDLLSVQAAAYGMYGVTYPDDTDGGQPAITAGPAETGWSLAEAPTSAGSTGLPLTASGKPAPYQPQYELVQWSDDPQPRFSLVEPLVPYSGPSGSGGPQTLSALMVASSDPQDFGALKLYDVDTAGVDGPYLADTHLVRIQSQITQQAANGSIQYGTIELLPVADSLLEIQPVYLATPASRYAVYDGVIVDYGKHIVFANTLDEALAHFVHGVPVAPSARPTAGDVTPAKIRSDVERADADFKKAQAALRRGDAGAWWRELAAAQRLIAEADALEHGRAGAATAGKHTSAPSPPSAQSQSRAAAPGVGAPAAPAATAAGGSQRQVTDGPGAARAAGGNIAATQGNVSSGSGSPPATPMASTSTVHSGRA